MVQGEKGHQLNKSKSLRGLTKDGFFLHGTPYPTDTHTSGSFESRGAAWEEGTVNGEWDEFFSGLSIAKMV